MDDDGRRLPLVAPPTAQSELTAALGRWAVRTAVRTAAAKRRCATAYGETPTDSYAVWDLGASCSMGRQTVTTVRAGVENVLDADYSTYSDWNHIPQKGRNLYVNLSVGF